MKNQTAAELLEVARRGRPGVRYAANDKGNAIAAWSDGRWIPVACIGIDGRWYSMTVELSVNGKPAWPQDCWIDDAQAELQAAETDF